MIYKPTKADRAIYDEMSVVILSPMTLPQPRWVKSVVNMTAYSWMNGLRVYQMGFTEKVVVDWARNSLARSALDATLLYEGEPLTGKPFTHFLWLDDDHTFNPDMACYLARHFAHRDVDAVSALYYNRSMAPLPVCFVRGDSNERYKLNPLVGVPACLAEVEAVGFGGLMMKRDVFERVPEPWFTIDFRAGEDIAFCVHAKENGVRFYVDGSYKMGHIGQAPTITEETFKQHMADNEVLYADKIRVPLGGIKNGV